MPPPARALRGMAGRGGARGARRSGRRGRWGSVHRRCSLQTNRKCIKGACRQGHTAPARSKLGRPSPASASRTRDGSACPVWCVSSSPSPTHSCSTSVLSRIAFVTTISPEEEHYLCSTTTIRTWAGSVWARGAHDDSSVLAVSGVPWCVAPTVSPCPLLPEWTQRLRRSPPDVGPLGNLGRRPPRTRGGLCARPGGGGGASAHDAVLPSLSSHVVASTLRPWPPPPGWAGLAAAASVVPSTLVPPLPPGPPDGVGRRALSPAGPRRPGRRPAVSRQGRPVATRRRDAAEPGRRAPAAAGVPYPGRSAPGTTDGVGWLVARGASPRRAHPGASAAVGGPPDYQCREFASGCPLAGAGHRRKWSAGRSDTEVTAHPGGSCALPPS